ncbi:Replication termination factor 2 [Frankliniella fusca]|uniref:Replication termination factor 2 n=1 Tax=Frankliniella fusca TaxID=407009 RepID=A0AAE1GTG4_9NEOP|nr:Replication termination factor 2 [Frankliniella fusca]
MGNDGGTIPRRDELVRLKKKKEQKDKDSELSFRWRHCNITQEPLEEPISACGLGRLYKKQAVIEALLDRSILPPSASHIKSIKDVRDLRLTPNPSFKSGAEKAGYVDRATSPYICPLTGLEVTGRFRFVFLWTCGCVFAERAMKEIKERCCQKCQTPFKEEDIVILNGTEEEIDGLRVRMEARQARLRAEKKAKSEAKKKSKLASGDSVEPSSSAAVMVTLSESAQPAPLEANIKLPTKPKLVPAAAACSSKLPAAAAACSSKLHIGNSAKSNSGEKRAATDKMNDPAFKKSRESYHVAADPKASEVFKSLFTSHKSHEKQTRAHWVTYNPFYN